MTAPSEPPGPDPAPSPSPPAETPYLPGSIRPYAALEHPTYFRYWCGNFCSIFGTRVMSVTVGWDIYERTGSPLSLAWVGLVQVLPIVSLVLVAGMVADRYDRCRVLIGTNGVACLAGLLMAFGSTRNWPVETLYLLLFLSATARAFQQPAKASLLPQLVPRELFPNAVMWNAAGFQLASVTGPALGGYLIWRTDGATAGYQVQALSAAVFLGMLAILDPTPAAVRKMAFGLSELTAGFGFLRKSPVLLGAMALDMFGVMFGGVVALLPIYAKDILAAGPAGLGWMQAADALGAVAMSFVLTHLPPFRKAGRAMLSAVVCFGLATILFGLSRSYPLSLFLLLLVGAFDTISVVVRQTLVQLLTPDELRGRVSAVNGLFISISNELGAFESGMVAHWTSPTFSVVSGGVGTLIVTAIVAYLVPGLRNYGKLTGPVPEPTPPAASDDPTPPAAPADELPLRGIEVAPPAGKS